MPENFVNSPSKEGCSSVHVADAHAEEQPAFREDVDPCEFLGEDHRLPLGKQNDSGADLDGLRFRREEGERCDGVDEGRVRRDRRWRNLRVHQYNVLARPDGFEAGGLGRRGEALDCVRVVEGAEVGAEVANVHVISCGSMLLVRQFANSPGPARCKARRVAQRIRSLRSAAGQR
jgi:hypothetical protein